MNWIRESNLIEDIDDSKEDARSQKAWDYFRKQELNLKTILAVHKKITSVQLGVNAGRLRKCDVTVGGRICPAWGIVPKLMNIWTTKWDTLLSPGNSQYLHASIFEYIKRAHIEFEKIHPFVDGNGRTGRMILNWQMEHCGLEVLMIKAEERDKYYEWFK